MISKISEGLLGAFNYLLHTLTANWHILLFGILIAVTISVYVDAEKTRKLFLRRPRFLLLGSVAFGVFTPLCACGTMAVVLSLVSSTIPWGVIMAFLVSSPLMSPDTFVVLSGFLGLNFASALAASSIMLGLGAGWVTHLIEKRTGFLDNQLRLNAQQQSEKDVVQFNVKVGNKAKANKQKVSLAAITIDGKANTVCCSVSASGVCCGDNSAESFNGNSLISFLKRVSKSLKLKKFGLNFFNLALVKVLPLFVLFVVIAYLVKEYVPTVWIVKFFSGEHFYSIPLAALIGLPMYVSDATVVPLLQVLRDAGASDGAILAYMISGPATSLGVIGGLAVIMNRRAILLYLAIILIGAILLGYAYDLFLSII